MNTERLRAFSLRYPAILGVERRRQVTAPYDLCGCLAVVRTPAQSVGTAACLDVPWDGLSPHRKPKPIDDLAGVLRPI